MVYFFIILDTMFSKTRKRKFTDNNADHFGNNKKFYGLDNLDREIFFHNNIYFNDNGFTSLTLTDTKDTTITHSGINLKQNDDLCITSLFLPVETQNYTEGYIKFWNKAINVDECPENKDIYLAFSPKLEYDVFFKEYDKDSGKMVVFLKIVENFNIKYYLDPRLFFRYTHDYNILNQETNKFFKKRLFNLKQCLIDNDNILTFGDDFNIKDSNLDGNVHLHYDSELKIFDYLLTDTTPFNPNYFHLEFKKTFDTFMIHNNQVFNCNLYDYLFPDAYSNEHKAVMKYIKTEKPTHIFNNFISFNTKYIFCLENSPTTQDLHYLHVNKGIIYVSIARGTVFMNTPFFKKFGKDIKVTRTNVIDIVQEKKLLQYKNFMINNSNIRMYNRELFKIEFLSIITLNGTSKDMNELISGLFFYYPYTSKYDIDLSVIKNKDDEPSLFNNKDFKFYWSNITSANNILNSTFEKYIKMQTNYISDSPVTSGLIQNNLLKNIDIKLFKFSMFDKMLQHDATPINISNNVASYLAYSNYGTLTYLNSYNNKMVKILSYINLDKTKINFIEDELSYTTALNKINIPITTFYDGRSIDNFQISIRDFKGVPYTGYIRKAYRPSKKLTLQKNLIKQQKIIEKIMFNKIIIDSRNILLSVPDNSTNEEVTLDNTILSHILYGQDSKAITNNVICYLSYFSFPTLLKNNPTTIMHVACNRFKGTKLSIFIKDSINGQLKYNDYQIIATINLSEIPNWNIMKENDDRYSISFTPNSSSFITNYYLLDTVYDLQNMELYLIDELGNKITYEKTTTRRPQYTLTLNYYKI